MYASCLTSMRTHTAGVSRFLLLVGLGLCYLDSRGMCYAIGILTFLDEGKLYYFIFYRKKLHKKFVVKTLIVGPAILNIATGQNVFCV